MYNLIFQDMSNEKAVFYIVAQMFPECQYIEYEIQRILQFYISKKKGLCLKKKIIISSLKSFKNATFCGMYFIYEK